MTLADQAGVLIQAAQTDVQVEVAVLVQVEVAILDQDEVVSFGRVAVASLVQVEVASQVVRNDGLVELPCLG